MRLYLRRYPVAVLFILTFAISWLSPLPWVLAGAKPSLGTFVIGAMGPTIAALAVTWGLSGREGVRELLGQIGHWRTGWRWWLLALGFFPSAMLVAMGIHALGGGEVPPWSFSKNGHPGHPSPMWLVWCLPFAALLEEMGWRGVAMPRLCQRYSTLVASLLVGGAWACWHLPLFFLPDTSHSNQSFIPYFAFALMLSVWHGWLYQGTRSLLLVTVLHASLNYTILLFPGGRNEAITTMMGGIIFLATVGLVMAARLYRRDGVAS